MKIYNIYDEEINLYIGTLLYYEKENSYIIELSQELDEWSAPLLFTGLVKKGIYTVPREISFLWVKERVIPSGRQNIQSILKTHRLKEYDELKFIELSRGRCSQDSMYIEKTDVLPEFVKKRMERNITECVICECPFVLCFFHDETIKKVDLTKCVDVDQLDRVLNNNMLFETGKVATGGYSITFNENIDVPAWKLYECGDMIPLRMQDFKAFVEKNILDTTQSCELMECSRQNIAYMVRQKHLVPIKEEVRGNLYLKGEVLKNSW
ncbi:MAG: hypothetical protein K6G01_10070 [Eubacterium sp.]|nr:hypothetical protein [Eubacterium sp.]